MPNPKAEVLTRKEKETVVLLSIGTFLEYFDLFLYVHMAVLLNELFFPQTDPIMAKLLASTAFCMTFILRPVGGYVIGRIGDLYGRKSTIVTTTLIMGTVSLIMSLMPTYEKVGIAASIGIILCRMLQGFSSLGEAMGATVYVSETLKSPNRYFANGIIDTASRIGISLALGIASLVLWSGFSWRVVFAVGSAAAFIGMIARTRLRESTAFTANKNKEKRANRDKFINYIGLFLVSIAPPLGMYISYIYLGDFMKTNLGITAEDVINNNFKFSIINAAMLFVCAYLCKYLHPIKIIKFCTYLFIITFIAIPYCLHNINSLGGKSFIIVLQAGVDLMSITNLVVWHKHFSVSNRFTSVATIFGLATALSYAILSFGLPLLVVLFGHYGIWVLCIPLSLGFMVGIKLITNLEIKKGNYHHYPYKDEDVEADIHPYNYELGEEYKPYQKECKCSKRLIGMLESINKTAKKEVNIRLVEKAIAFAKKWHDGQKRKTGEPYYTHPLAVAMMTAQYKFKTHMVVAAILHDVVEDSKCTVELISKEFTPRIAEIVELLTREYNGKKLSIAETIKRIFGAEDYEALLIKGLDRVHNLQTIHGMKSKKQKEIAEETIYEIANVAAYAVDDLNINDKGKLERKLYKLSNKAIKKSNAL